MQALEIIESAPVFAPVPASGQPSVDSSLTAIQMRAMRRKARRISAYARFTVEALNALAVQVEADIASLQH